MKRAIIIITVVQSGLKIGWIHQESGPALLKNHIKIVEVGDGKNFENFWIFSKGELSSRMGSGVRQDNFLKRANLK
jgi:hypothetical protein